MPLSPRVRNSQQAKVAVVDPTAPVSTNFHQTSSQNLRQSNDSSTYKHFKASKVKKASFSREAGEKWAEDLLVSINDRKSVDTSTVLYLPPIPVSGDHQPPVVSPYAPKVPLKGGNSKSKNMHVSLVRHEDSDGNLLDHQDDCLDSEYNLEVKAIMQLQQPSHQDLRKKKFTDKNHPHKKSSSV